MNFLLDWTGLSYLFEPLATAWAERHAAWIFFAVEYEKNASTPLISLTPGGGARLSPACSRS